MGDVGEGREVVTAGEGTELEASCVGGLCGWGLGSSGAFTCCSESCKLDGGVSVSCSPIEFWDASSGLAIRRPPNDWERLKSPSMMDCQSAGRLPDEDNQRREMTMMNVCNIRSVDAR